MHNASLYIADMPEYHHPVLEYGMWEPTFLRASYQPYAIRNTIVAVVTHIPVIFLLRCVSLFPNAFQRFKSSIVFTTHGLLLFSIPQYVFYAGIALLVWENRAIPMAVCSILKNFTMYFAQIGFSVTPVVAVSRYLSIIWQFELDEIQAWICTLLLAVPNIALGIVHTFWGKPTHNDICDVLTVYHSDSGIILIQSYMILQQLIAIIFHLRVALYLRKLRPKHAGRMRPRLMNYSFRFKVIEESNRADYCVSLALLIHCVTILGAMAMQSAWGLIYLDQNHSITRTFLLDLIDTLPIVTPGLIAIASVPAIRESRTYVRQMTKRVSRGNPRIVTTSVSVIEN